MDGDSAPMQTLKQEVRNTLLNGAAVFFPDRQTRRSHLFAMMVIITYGGRAALLKSGGMTFISLFSLNMSSVAVFQMCI